MIIMICLCLFVTLPHCQEFPTDFYPMGLVIPWGVLFLGPWGASRTLLLKSQPTPGAQRCCTRVGGADALRGAMFGHFSVLEKKLTCSNREICWE